MTRTQMFGSRSWLVLLTSFYNLLKLQTIFQFLKVLITHKNVVYLTYFHSRYNCMILICMRIMIFIDFFILE